MDWLTALKSYQLVVEYNSFSKAASKRYASSSALSKQVAWLERELGQKLLHRTPHQLAMTESGEKLYHRSKYWLDDFDNLKLELQSDNQAPSGLLRVSAPKTFGSTVLTKHLPIFTKAYPDIRVDIQLDNNYVDMINDQVDVAIRTGDISEKSLISQPIGHQSIGLFASPQYLSNAPKIQNLSDIAEHRCLAHSDFIPANLWRFKKQVINVTPHLLTNDLNLLISSAIDGQGLLYISEYTVANAVDHNQLCPILSSCWKSKVLHSVVYPRQKHLSKKIQCFVEFIMDVKW